MKKSDLLSLSDDLHIECYALVLLIIGWFEPVVLVFLGVYLWMLRQRIRWMVFIGLSSVVFFALTWLSEGDLPDQAEGVATVTHIEKTTYGYRLTLKLDRKNYHAHVKETYALGDRIYVKGDIESYRDQTIPRGFNPYRYFKSEGIDGSIRIKSLKWMEHRPHMFAFRMKLIESLSGLKSEQVVKTMVFGEIGLEKTTKDLLKSIGIFYLFSMTGLHVYALMEGIRKIMLYLDLHPRIQDLILILFLVGMLYLQKGSYVMMRLLLMLIFSRLNDRYQLGQTSLDRIQLTHIVIMGLNLRLLFSLGFLMSYLIVNVFNLTKSWYQADHPFVSQIISTGIIQSVLMPWLGRFSPLMIPIFPIFRAIMSFLISPICFLVLFIPELDAPLSIMFSYVISMADMLETRNMSVFLPSLPAILMMTYYIGLAMAFRSTSVSSMIMKWLVISLLFLTPELRIYKPDEVAFLDVGQGDAIYIRAEGCEMLVDAYRGSFDYLTHHGIRQLDYLILTHADNDHTEEALEIAKHVHVKHVLLSAYDMRYETGLGKITRTKSGDRFGCGRLHIDILGPISNHQSSNNLSIVFQVEIHGMVFLFAGDIEKEAEMELVQTYGDRLKSDVLKIAHHGSKTSTSDLFIEAVQPSVAVISAGWKNQFGFPDDQVIQRLMKHNVSIYRTDQHGTIRCIFGQKREKWKLHLPYAHRYLV